MTRRLRSLTLNVLLPFLLASGLLITPLLRAASAQDGAQGGGAQGEAQLGGASMSSAAQQQVQALLEEKESRTPAQRKISSQLLYTMKARRGESITKGGEVKSMLSTVSPMDSAGRVEVDIKGKINKELIEIIEKTGGEILYVSERAGSVRARVPMESLEDLASLTNVRNIRPASRARTHRQLNGERRTSPATTPRPISPSRRSGLRSNFAQRASSVSTQLLTALPALTARTSNRPAQDGVRTNVGAVTSEGDVSHRAALARNVFNVSGMGVKIGVLSDSVDFLEDSIASGDLPPDVVILEGQGGVDEDSTGEGTAMLEIIHDVAPGAKLFFATAFNGIESFADNIRALRAQGCDIIVDDVIVSDESPFHTDIISTAVEEVTNDGALYFSSAGNAGNFNDGTSSVWEGDFKNSQTTLAALPGGTLHDFGTGVISNRVESSSDFVLALFWSDPLDASANDYDLFIMDSTLTTVIGSSTDIQDGNGDPFEILVGAEEGTRILIFKKNGAQRRALHLNNFGGELAISTPGSTHGHNSVAKAFGVAAINAAVARGGAFTGGPTNPVELFSSDGFRRVFFKSDGTPFKPGRFLFSNNGGEVRRKPDLTAADGVATNVPGFEQFFGTSAAAPHAAAIAALLKSARSRISPNRIREALTRTALDIEARGLDRDSGAGIVDAFAALQFIEPTPFLELGTVTTTPIGDDDDFIEPGERGAITARLVNNGGATAIGVRATLTTTTPGVTITNPSSNYPNIGSNGQRATNNRPFAFTLAETASCGLAIDFTLTVNYENNNSGPRVLTFQVITGEPGTTGTTISYTGPPVEIVDEGEVSIPLEVNGLTNAISDLNFSFDGSTCTSAAGAPAVGLDHTWIGDLVITLTSPQGTTVTLASRPGGILNGGNNFCNTVFDDSATALIQRITLAGAPYTGAFKPANPLAAFNGENANGTWVLNVADAAAGDLGNVRAFSLTLSTFTCDTP